MDKTIKTQLMICQTYCVVEVPEELGTDTMAVPFSVAAHLMPGPGPARVYIGPEGNRIRDKAGFQMIVDPGASEKEVVATVTMLLDHFTAQSATCGSMAFSNDAQFIYVENGKMASCGGRLNVDPDGVGYLTSHSLLKLTPRTRLIGAGVLVVPERSSVNEIRDALKAIRRALAEDGLSLGYLFKLERHAHAFEKDGRPYTVPIT